MHANTPGDAFAAFAAGVPAQDVVYSGTNLTGADLDYLLGLGVSLNVDSLDQLRDVVRRGCRSVGLRFLIDDPAKRNRIYVSPHELGEALRHLAEADAVADRRAPHVRRDQQPPAVSASSAASTGSLAAAKTLPDLECRESRRRLRDRLPRGRAGSRRRFDRAGGGATAAVAARGARHPVIVEPGRVLSGRRARC